MDAHKTISAKNLWFQLAALTLCFGALYHNVIASLVKDWTINDNYSHGFFIPVITAYLIWHKKNKLTEAPIRPSNLGALILGGGLCLFLLGDIGSELFITRFSMLVILTGLVIYLAGWQWARILAIPIAYLVFMIPLPAIIWNKIAFPLKLFATSISTTAIQWIGIVAYREGNIIHLSNTTLEVVDACSGLRSLFSLLALSAVFALLARHSKIQKWILFIAAVPIAIIVNLVRLTITAVLAEHYGPSVADGFLHNLSGLLVFFLAIVFIYIVHLLLQKMSPVASDNIRTGNA